MQFDLMTTDQARPGPGHGDNHHHSQKQQNQQCIQHCSHVHFHYQSTLSQIMLLLFNNFRRQNSAYVLSGWVTGRAPVDGALCSVDGIMGTSYGPSLRGRQDSKLFVIFFPTLPWLHVMALKLLKRPYKFKSCKYSLIFFAEKAEYWMVPTLFCSNQNYS